MRTQLDQWLKENKAKFPTPDPHFDSAKRDARWANIKTIDKKNREINSARYFDDNFIPNKTWWGSKVD